jgi:hypothetical protein
MQSAGETRIREAYSYLMAQSELGGSMLVTEALPVAPEAHEPMPAPMPVPMPAMPPPKAAAETEDQWQKASNLNDFYAALRISSLYKKDNRQASFFVPKDAKTNAPYLLVFHSPQEFSQEARELLERLLTKLNIALQSCSVSFFIKSNSTVMPREKKVLTEMLHKEVEMLAPERIIFFRENPKTEQSAKPDGKPITFAGKQAITLYSLLEMLPSKDKMRDTWNLIFSYVNHEF